VSIRIDKDIRDISTQDKTGTVKERIRTKGLGFEASDVSGYTDSLQERPKMGSYYLLSYLCIAA
jgi:hypothetical protein